MGLYANLYGLVSQCPVNGLARYLHIHLNQVDQEEFTAKTKTFTDSEGADESDRDLEIKESTCI